MVPGADVEGGAAEEPATSNDRLAALELAPPSLRVWRIAVLPASPASQSRIQHRQEWAIDIGTYIMAWPDFPVTCVVQQL